MSILRRPNTDLVVKKVKGLAATFVLVALAWMSSDGRTRVVRPLAMEHAVLRGVRITMKDGRKLVGYVGWTSEEFKYDKNPRFPQSILDPTAWLEETKTLELYTTLYPVSKKVLRRAFPDDRDWRMVIGTRSGTLKLPIKQIARIRALPMKYDGIEATIDGLITYIHSRSTIQLLMNGTPVATIPPKDDAGYVLVSFNSQIGRRRLGQIYNRLVRLSAGGATGLEKDWERARRHLERRRVVMIDYIAVD